MDFQLYHPLPQGLWHNNWHMHHHYYTNYYNYHDRVFRGSSTYNNYIQYDEYQCC